MFEPEPPWQPTELFADPKPKASWPSLLIFIYGPPDDETLATFGDLAKDGLMHWVGVPLWSRKGPRMMKA